MRARSFLVGAIGGIAGAALLFLVLFLLGVTNVTKETVAVTPALFQTPTGGVANAASGGLTPAQIYAKEATGVVEIISTFPASGVNPFDPFGSPQPSQGLGSGFVASKDGYILTNAHVVSDNGQKATKITVAFKSGGGNTTNRVPGTIVGIDLQSDVALIKVDPSGLALNPLPLGNSDQAYVGEPVVAIGNPLGFDFSLTSGIVSAVHRDLTSPSNTTIPNGIQTDAAINEGNSGGPLINPAGQVIGINEQIASPSAVNGQAGNVGLGFAVPVNTALNSMTQLKATGKVAYAWLGVSMQTVTPDVATTLKLQATTGALIASVSPNGPALKAGVTGGTRQVTIQGQPFTVGGDIVTAIDGKAVTSADDLQAAIASHKPGDKVTLKVVHANGSTQDITVTLGTRPAGL